jgi:hypothetical protein
MGALESNTTLIYGIHVRESANDGSDFTNAAADYRVLILGEDGLLHVKDSAGTVTSPYTGGGGSTASGARVYNSTAINLNNGTFTYLTFDTERYDDAAYHSTSVNTGRLTVPATGRFLIGAHVQVTAAGGAVGYIGIRQGGSTFIGVQNYDLASTERYASISTVWDCTAGTEYFELGVMIDAASKQALAAAAFSPEFWIERLGDT